VPPYSSWQKSQEQGMTNNLACFPQQYRPSEARQLTATRCAPQGDDSPQPHLQALPQFRGRVCQQPLGHVWVSLRQ
jgi:hypothetical protein